MQYRPNICVTMLRMCAFRGFLLLAPLVARVPVEKTHWLLNSVQQATRSGGEAVAILCRIGTGLVAVGGYHTLAGATQTSFSQTPNPVQTGQNVLAVFQITGTPVPARSFRSEGELPPGLRYYTTADAPNPVEGNIVNANRLFIRGQPLQPGNYNLTITAYRGLNANAEGTIPVSTPVTIVVVGDPIENPAAPVDFTLGQNQITGAFTDFSWGAVAQDVSVEIFHATDSNATNPQLISTSTAGSTGVSFPETLPMDAGDHYFWYQAARGNLKSELQGPELVRVLTAPLGASASQGDFTDKIEVVWDAVADATDYQVLVEGVVTPFIVQAPFLDFGAAADQQYTITVFGRYEGTLGKGTTVTGSTQTTQQARKFLTGFLEGDDGFQFNAMGFVYEGFYPFLYIFNYGNWVYVFNDPPNDQDGWFLYDFHWQGFGFSAASVYPFYFGLSEGKPEVVDLSVAPQ